MYFLSFVDEETHDEQEVSQIGGCFILCILLWFNGWNMQIKKMTFESVALSLNTNYVLII